MDKHGFKLVRSNIIMYILFTAVMLAIITASNIITDIYSINLKHTVEQTWREQARRTLRNINATLDHDIEIGEVDPMNDISLQNWAKYNVSGTLNGGDTGDVFIIELGSEKFIWDGSPDCAKPEFTVNGRYMKDEAEMHRNKAQAEKMLNAMRIGETTDAEDNYWWQFDDSKELLEWTTNPMTKYGYKDEPYSVGGVKNQHFRKILIQLGTQEDEILKPYKSIFDTLNVVRKDIYLLCGSIVVFAVIFSIYLMMSFVRCRDK